MADNKWIVLGALEAHLESENHIPIRLGWLKAVRAPFLRVGLLHAEAVLKQTP